MNKSDLHQHHNITVLVHSDGQQALAKLDTQMFPDKPCLTLPKEGKWEKVEPYFLTDSDIRQLHFDADSRVIRSPLRFDTTPQING